MSKFFKDIQSGKITKLYSPKLQQTVFAKELPDTTTHQKGKRYFRWRGLYLKLFNDRISVVFDENGFPIIDGMDFYSFPEGTDHRDFIFDVVKDVSEREEEIRIGFLQFYHERKKKAA